MSKTEKKYLPFPLFVVIALAVGGSALYLIKSYAPVAQPLEINVIGDGTNPTATVTLESSPSPRYVHLGKPVSFDINAKNITDPLTGITLELTYPAGIMIDAIVPTDFLPTVLSQPVRTTLANDEGSITTSYGVPPESGGRNTSWGTVAKVTLKSNVLGEKIIFFGSNSIATTINSNISALAPTEGGTGIVLYTYNSGDFNFNKTVDIFDYNTLIADFGKPYTIFDYNDLIANFGKTSP